MLSNSRFRVVALSQTKQTLESTPQISEDRELNTRRSCSSSWLSIVILSSIGWKAGLGEVLVTFMRLLLFKLNLKTVRHSAVARDYESLSQLLSRRILVLHHCQTFP